MLGWTTIDRDAIGVVQAGRKRLPLGTFPDELSVTNQNVQCNPGQDPSAVLVRLRRTPSRLIQEMRGQMHLVTRAQHGLAIRLAF